MQIPEITKISASEIVIDPELSKLFPRYSETAFAGLEQDLLRDGCLAPLILWDKTLIDGHNRFKIIKKHNLDFYVIQKEFSSRDDVKIWMIRLVIDQRNLTPEQLSYYRGMHYLADKRVRGRPEVRTHEENKTAQVEQFNLDGLTATRLAQEYNVSSATIRRDSNVATAINRIAKKSLDAKEMILDGDANISRLRLTELAAASETEVRDTIDQILGGTHEFRREREPTIAALARRNDAPPWVKELHVVADSLGTSIKSLATYETADEKRSKIREIINMFEKLYERV